MNTKAIVHSVALLVVQSLGAADQVSLILPESAKFYVLKALVPKSCVLKNRFLISEAVELTSREPWLQTVELPSRWQDYKVVVCLEDSAEPGYLVFETSPIVVQDQKYLVAKYPSLFACQITLSGIPSEWQGKFHMVGWYESTEGLSTQLTATLDLRAKGAKHSKPEAKSAAFTFRGELDKAYTIEIQVAKKTYQWKNVKMGVQEVAKGITLDFGAATVTDQHPRWSIHNIILPDGSLDIPKK